MVSVLIVALLLTVPVWARVFGYRGRPSKAEPAKQVSRNQTGPAWEQDVPYALDLDDEDI